MRYALFLGCTIPARLKQYEASARAVLEQLDVEVVDIKDFNCCGYPMRNHDEDSFLLSSARNIALAHREGLDIITLCKCCFGSLKNAMYKILDDPSKRKKIDSFLEGEKLKFNEYTEIKHILSLLYHDIGIDAIKEKIKRPFNNIKIAAHYGCHALRPSEIMQFDDPENPEIFDRLVEVTGSESISWQSRLECCGAPILGANDELSSSIMKNKIADGIESGADYLCTACPYCQLQFDTVQHTMISDKKIKDSLPSILYTQLLGLSMGIDADTLQIDMNQLDISGIENNIPEIGVRA